MFPDTSERRESVLMYEEGDRKPTSNEGVAVHDDAPTTENKLKALEGGVNVIISTRDLDPKTLPGYDREQLSESHSQLNQDRAVLTKDEHKLSNDRIAFRCELKDHEDRKVEWEKRCKARIQEFKDEKTKLRADQKLVGNRETEVTERGRAIEALIAISKNSQAAFEKEETDWKAREVEARRRVTELKEYLGKWGPKEQKFKEWEANNTKTQQQVDQERKTLSTEQKKWRETIARSIEIDTGMEEREKHVAEREEAVSENEESVRLRSAAIYQREVTVEQNETSNNTGGRGISKSAERKLRKREKELNAWEYDSNIKEIDHQAEVARFLGEKESFAAERLGRMVNLDRKERQLDGLESQLAARERKLDNRDNRLQDVEDAILALAPQIQTRRFMY